MFSSDAVHFFSIEPSRPARTLEIRGMGAEERYSKISSSGNMRCIDVANCTAGDQVCHPEPRILEVFMKQSDLNTTTKGELRAYIITHPDDPLAFRVFVDRFTADVSSTTYDLPHSHEDITTVEDLIRQKLNSSGEE
jgi:hypothetical protein